MSSTRQRIQEAIRRLATRQPLHQLNFAQIAKEASANSGSLQTQIDSLQTQDSTMQQKVNDINNAAAAFQNQLEMQYAKYQAAIQSADNTLNYLTALLNAKSR